MTREDRSARMDAARRHAGLSVQDLWLCYLGLGGTEDVFDLDGYLQGLMPLQEAQQDVLAQTLNDALIDHHDAYRIPATDCTAPDPHDDTRLRKLVNELLDQTAPEHRPMDGPTPDPTS